MSELDWTKPCDECGTDASRYRGEGDVSCPAEDCAVQYNAFGQRLRSNWVANASAYDKDISDLDGYEMAELQGESFW